MIQLTLESLANYSLKFICRSSQIIKNFVIKKNYKTFSIIKIGKLKEFIITVFL